MTDEPVDRDLIVPVIRGLVADPVSDDRVVRCHCRRAGHGVHPASLGEQIGGADDHLRRDAPVVRAFTTDEVTLDADHRETGLGERTGSVLSSRAESDNNNINLVNLHATQSLDRRFRYTISRSSSMARVH